MLSEERKTKIIEMLKERNFLKISDLIEEFSVSHETIRRDLEELQSMGIAKRLHGGAVYVQKENGTPEKASAGRYSSENQIVAQFASKLVKPGMLIYIDNGHTMGYLASFVKGTPNLTVITSSLSVANELVSGKTVDLHLLGGKVDMDELAITGKATEDSFRKFNVEYAFMSCGGLDLKSGNINDFDDYGLSRKLIRERSEKVVLLLNSGKLGKRYLSNLSNLSDVDIVIIDSNITAEQEEILRSYVPEVIVVPMNQTV